MSEILTHNIRLDIGGGITVSAIVSGPPKSETCYVFAHGAGAGMTHQFMDAVARGLAARSITTLRYQFPYMEAGRKRPDRPAIAHATVRAAAAEAVQRFPRLVIIAGGKSFGGRMTSQAQAIAPLPGVSALAFFGFPLHPTGKSSDTRAAHLFDVKLPMLFLQGARDKLADLTLLEPVTAKLGKSATLITIAHADHGFHVLKRSGQDDNEVLEVMLDKFAKWAHSVKASNSSSKG